MTKFRHALPTILFALLLVGAVPTRADIVCVPDTVSLTAATPAVDLVWSYTGGGSANVAGYSIVVAWDPALVTPTFARPDNGPFAGAATFFVVPLGSGQARVDAAIGGADPGIASGELGKVTLTGVGGQAGETALDLTLSALRDPDNLDVTGVTALDAVVLVDIGAPVVAGVAIANSTLPHTDDFVKDGDALVVTATVTDEDPGFGASGITADLSGLGGAADAAPDDWTAPVATWNVAAATCTPADGTITVTVTATDSGGNVGTGSDGITADNTPPTALQDLTVLPGHEKIHLAWTDAAASDANPWQVVFRTATWDDYPAYATAAPAYPADHLAGDAVFDTTGTAADWAVTPRAIRYVAGFVTDMVLQTGPAGPTSTGRATNYWLGDVAGAAGYDGSVDIIHDITLLGTTYGLADTAAAYLPECNVGPTDTRSPRGIPEPGVDAEVGFEDMMVFALNYTVVTPGAKAAAGLPRFAWRRVSDRALALDVVAAGDFQGLRLQAAVPAGCTVAVTPGPLVAAQAAPTFLRDTPAAGLDVGLAVFGAGAGFRGTGELLRLTAPVSLPDLDLRLTARDTGNRDVALVLAAPDGGDPVPAAAGFAGNFPNPFNPRTTLVFDLPRRGPVEIAVYGLDGRRVRTLAAGVREAGRHEIAWDGCDAGGRPVAAGTYFARLTAGAARDTRKMVLVK